MPPGGVRKAPREAPGASREAPGKPRKAPGRLSWATCMSEPVNLPKVAFRVNENAIFGFREAPGKPPGGPREASEMFPGRLRDALGRLTREALEGSRKAKLANMHVRTRQLATNSNIQLFLSIFCTPGSPREAPGRPPKGHREPPGRHPGSPGSGGGSYVGDAFLPVIRR